MRDSESQGCQAPAAAEIAGAELMLTGDGSGDHIVNWQRPI